MAKEDSKAAPDSATPTRPGRALPDTLLRARKPQPEDPRQLGESVLAHFVYAQEALRRLSSMPAAAVAEAFPQRVPPANPQAGGPPPKLPPPPPPRPREERERQ